MNNHVMTIWRPTYHYGKIKSEGRNRPAPNVGSPTMVWHLGIWRKHNHAKGLVGATGVGDYIVEYQTRSEEFFSEVSQFLLSLQERGVLLGVEPQPVELTPIALEGVLDADPKAPTRFSTYASQSMNFELWWLAEAANGSLNTRVKPDDPRLALAFRVFVQFQSFQDHVTLTFYIDAAKRYGGAQMLIPSELKGDARREVFLGHLEEIRKSSYAEISSGRIDLPDVVDSEIPELDAAVAYFYRDIWDNFQKAFGFSSGGEPTLQHGVVFANQRGLMMSMRGLTTQTDEIRAQATAKLAELNNIPMTSGSGVVDQAWRPDARSADATLGPVDVFDPSSGEAAVLLKSLWPFLCRMSPGAESKDWVGSGILNWRALFVSPLGSRPMNWDFTAERTADELGPTLNHDPEHFLIVTKGEPHRRQIGRMIERVLSLETMRLFAFKNLGVIHNAYIYLRVITTHLDDLLKDWSDRRQKLETDFGDWKREAARRPGNEPGWVPPPAVRQKEEDYFDELSKLNSENETLLIQIAAETEKMGPGGSGHLAYSIDRATFFIDEFDRMVPTLEIENIPGWINYSQFADRGMRPTFNMIQTTGRRLIAANERLKALTDVVQVSALIVQSAATRRNTDALATIATNVHQLKEWERRMDSFRNKLIPGGTLGWWVILALMVAFGAERLLAAYQTVSTIIGKNP
jgi:hypothetical protein